MKKPGTVYLVGAGPGDPNLLTVKGCLLLQEADVVVYDHLVSPRLLKGCSPDVKFIYVGKETDRHTLNQGTINRLLVRAARAGKTIVRLKGGDPFLFGRGAEEALELRRAGVPCEMVPGVTSAVAVPAYAGIPVTYRKLSSSVAIVTGHEDPEKPSSSIRWAPLAKACDTLVFLMGVSTLPAIAAALIRHGRKASTPCAVIEWGTTPAQRTLSGTLQTLAREAKRSSIKPPAVLVVGDVVRLRRQLNWFETKPLFGQRILVTRSSEKAAAFTDRLEALGASVEELPAIALAPVKANGAFRDAIHNLPETDWVFFTSPEGIGWFAKMLKPYRKDVRSLSGCHIGAIGPKTAAAIEEAGLHVDFVPRAFSQEGMLKDFPRRVLEGKRAMILSAEGSRDALEQGLRRRGMFVQQVPIYRTILPQPLLQGVRTMFGRSFDLVTVTSASCVDHLCQALAAVGRARLIRSLRFASIGPVTSAALRRRGGRVAVEARVATIEGLVDAIVRKR
jgi:uroporphyrinogen III methyltransferase/synthase